MSVVVNPEAVTVIVGTATDLVTVCVTVCSRCKYCSSILHDADVSGDGDNLRVLQHQDFELEFGKLIVRLLERQYLR